jgi:hypothetical protein
MGQPNSQSAIQTNSETPSPLHIIRSVLESAGLNLYESPKDLMVTNPHRPEQGRFTLDYECKFLAWERTEFSFWNFEDLTDPETAEFIATKIKALLTKQ